jgi:hypothetical protein
MEQLITYLEDQLHAWERVINDPDASTEALIDLTARIRATTRLVQQIIDAADAERASA